MEKFDWHRKLKTLLFCFRIVGLWPDDRELYACNLYTAYVAVALTFLGFCHNLVQIIKVFLVPIDLEVLAGTLFITSQVTALFKSVGFVRQMKMIKELIFKLNSDVFQPRTLQQRSTTASTLEFWYKLYAVYVMSLFSTCFLWLLFPMLDKSYKESRLPLFAWYPYDYSQSPLYEITYLYQGVSLLYLNMCNSNLDMFSVVLMICIGAQCDILCDNLRRIGKIKQDEEYGCDEFDEEVIQMIRQHKEMLSFVTNFNKFVDKILLAQFITSSLSLALCFFQLTLIVPFSSEFFSIVSLVISVTFQIFLYCWYGNEVDFKSSKISYAAFESRWIGASKKAQRILMIFSLRTHQQITIKTFNLFPLSLATFTSIMRTAWSYFVVLRQVNVPNE